MYRYSIDFESVSGDSHDIIILHEEKMNRDQLFQKLCSIAESINFDRGRMDYLNNSEFRMFLDEIKKHGFVFEQTKTEADVHISEIAQGQKFY